MLKFLFARIAAGLMAVFIASLLGCASVMLAAPIELYNATDKDIDHVQFYYGSRPLSLDRRIKVGGGRSWSLNNSPPPEVLVKWEDGEGLNCEKTVGLSRSIRYGSDTIRLRLLPKCEVEIETYGRGQLPKK